MKSASPEEIAAATAYEELHVPALFGVWAPHVAAAAEVRPGNRVLDVGCGTGILSREVARRLGGKGSVVGLDPSPGMLAVAGRLDPSVTWRKGSAESLPFPDNSFDTVVSQFALMFFLDRPKAVAEMKRVLRPGGGFAVAVWDALQQTEAYSIEVDLLQTIAGPQAAEALRAPFVLGNRDELADLFESAGLSSVKVGTYRERARFPKIRVMVEADLRGWLPVMGVFLKEEQVQRILDEAEVALQRYVTSGGLVEFEMPALIVTGTRI